MSEHSGKFVTTGCRAPDCKDSEEPVEYSALPPIPECEAKSGGRTELLTEYGRLFKQHRAVHRQPPVACSEVESETGISPTEGQQLNKLLPSRRSSSGSTMTRKNSSYVQASESSITSCDGILQTAKQREAATGQGTAPDQYRIQLKAPNGPHHCVMRNSRWSSPSDDPWLVQYGRSNSSFGATAHDGSVTCLLLSPDGFFLISSGADGRIRLWNAVNGSSCFVHMSLDTLHRNSSRLMPLSTRRTHISQMPADSRGMTASAGARSTSSFWGRQAAISSSGDLLIHGRGRFLCTYDIFSGNDKQVVGLNHPHDVVCVTWNEQKGEVYSGSSDGTVTIFDANCKTHAAARLHVFFRHTFWLSVLSSTLLCALASIQVFPDMMQIRGAATVRRVLLLM